jgi:hypothetical protein
MFSAALGGCVGVNSASATGEMFPEMFSPALGGCVGAKVGVGSRRDVSGDIPRDICHVEQERRSWVHDRGLDFP